MQNYWLCCVKLTERWTPFDWQSLRSLSCCQTGWHSTWLTAGGTRATANKSSSFLHEKLLTPIARALPESYSFSIAPQVAGILVGIRFSGLIVVPFLIRIGPWICKVRLLSNDQSSHETNGNGRDMLGNSFIQFHRELYLGILQPSSYSSVPESLVRWKHKHLNSTNLIWK